MLDWSWIQSVPDWAKFVSGGLIVLFVQKYLPSYLTEKGKNLATKEDIGKITKITEESRREYVHEVERLRNDLTILREDLTSVRAQGREAVVMFLDSCNVFLYEFVARRLPDRGTNDYDVVDNYLHTLDKYIANIGLAHTRLFAYFHEERNVLEAANTAMSAARKLNTAIRKKVTPLLIIRHKLINMDSRRLATEAPALLIEHDEKEKEFDAEIEAPREIFSRAFVELTDKTSSFFERLHLKSGDRF